MCSYFFYAEGDSNVKTFKVSIQQKPKEKTETQRLQHNENRQQQQQQYQLQKEILTVPGRSSDDGSR